MNLWRSPCLALLYKEDLQTRDKLLLLAVDSALLIRSNHEISGTQTNAVLNWAGIYLENAGRYYDQQAASVNTLRYILCYTWLRTAAFYSLRWCNICHSKQANKQSPEVLQTFPGRCAYGL